MDKLTRRKFVEFSLAAGGLYLLNPLEVVLGQKKCPATRPDVLGPFYREGAPERYELGEENNLVVYGYVTSLRCEPLAGATIEVWQATPDAAGAEYVGFESPDFEYYATMYTDEEGYYQFVTDMPGLYVARPIRHIHFVVNAKGYRRLITQLYFGRPGKETKAEFNIALLPEK